MKSSTIAAVVGVFGGALLLFGGGDGGGGFRPSGDVLSDCYRADRLSKTALLFEMAGKDFASDEVQAKWWNSEIESARSTDFQPFVDAVASAIESNTVEDLAKAVEVAK